jgi:hypothetical protein
MEKSTKINYKNISIKYVSIYITIGAILSPMPPYSLKDYS